MKLLLISPSYYPVLGGGETHVRTLAEGLVSRGHQVTVLTGDNNQNLLTSEIINGVYVFRTKTEYDSAQYANRPQWERGFYWPLIQTDELLSNSKFDLIHAHCQAAILIGAILKRQKEVEGALHPLVATFHETILEDEPLGKGLSHLICTNLPIDRFIVGSEFFKEQALRHGANPELVVKINMGVDLSRFNPEISGQKVRRFLGINEMQPVVLVVARFKPRKGLLEFVRAISYVIKKIPTVQALMVGSVHSASSEYVDLIKEEAKRLAIKERVIIAENVFSWEDMPEVYAASSIVVQPSYAEGLGLSVLEAMATARPVIASDVSGIREILGELRDTVLVPAGDTSRLARMISMILKQPKLSQHIAQNQHQIVAKHFNAANTVKGTELIYRELII